MVIGILERILNRLENMINRLSRIIEDMKGEPRPKNENDPEVIIRKQLFNNQERK